MSEENELKKPISHLFKLVVDFSLLEFPTSWSISEISEQVNLGKKIPFIIRRSLLAGNEFSLFKTISLVYKNSDCYDLSVGAQPFEGGPSIFALPLSQEQKVDVHNGQFIYAGDSYVVNASRFYPKEEIFLAIYQKKK